ncbi:MAG: nucleoside triphosphate pyrophosphohydrolase [Acidobacteria bacterium]|nr:nucleoside triphosphate pyrophosphohydrolase [Acidobacteriota bacterium]
MAVVPSPARRGRGRSPRRATPAAAFARLVAVMHTLRAPGGCPWDRKQTHRSLRSYLLEETYEALEAIDGDDLDALAGELGDVLLQVVFHAEIAAEAHRFDVVDVISLLTAKLIRRHPHVFTPTGRPLRKRTGRSVRSPRQVVEQWQELKAGEQKAAGRQAGLLSGVPRGLPALLRAHKIGGRVAAVGFDWPNPEAVVDKIDEEVRELRGALAEGHARVAEELGDLLFTLANLARHLGVEPESALREANDKFTRRFGALEATLAAGGRSVGATPPDTLDAVWNLVKRRSATRGRSGPARASGARAPRAHRSRR